MPRFARVVIPQCAHHITQRGNARRDTFFTPADRDVYLGLLKRYAQFHQVAVMGYCLMSNHVHLVLTPDTEVGLAKTLRVVHMRYSQYRNALEDLAQRRSLDARGIAVTLTVLFGAMPAT